MSYMGSMIFRMVWGQLGGLTKILVILGIFASWSGYVALKTYNKTKAYYVVKLQAKDLQIKEMILTAKQEQQRFNDELSQARIEAANDKPVPNNVRGISRLYGKDPNCRDCR